MGKSKKKQKQRTSNEGSSGIFDAKPAPNLDTLIEEAEAAIDSFSYEEAIPKLKDVLKFEQNHTKAAEMLSGIYIELCNYDEAQDLLKHCISVSPDIGFSKYFSMGQLTDGEESLSFYNKGIQVLQKELENAENINPSEDQGRKTLVRSLSEAYCSVAEIYMTDCCFAENSEENCFSAIENSIQSDPSNPEAYHCLANFHLVKEQFDEAKEAVKKSLALWLPHHESLRDGETEDASKDIENLIPSYESRIQLSKLLIELEMYDEATNVLNGLIEEDDEVIEVWYLLGWMNYCQGDEYKLNAHFYLKKAKEVSDKLGMDDLDYISHIHELLEEIEAKFPQVLEEEEEEEGWKTDIASDTEEEEEMDV